MHDASPIRRASKHSGETNARRGNTSDTLQCFAHVDANAILRAVISHSTSNVRLMTPDDVFPADGEIKSIAGALRIAERWSSLSRWEWPSGWKIPRYTPPFGIWYRGQSISVIPRPSVFRPQKDPKHPRSRPMFFDESSLVRNFQVRSPQYRASHDSTFEWLCLMQHYGAPTRLLDWSESVLVALYFAVAREQDLDKDGELYILNSALLNAHADVDRPDRRARTHTPDSYNVVVRSLMARHRESYFAFSSPEIRRHAESDQPRPDPLRKLRRVGSDDDLEASTDPETVAFLKQLRKPVAVVPPRNNSRLLTQQGMFTIHGGKAFRDSVVTSPLLRPFGFEDFDPDIPFLRRYHVPKACKERIRRQLNAAGIHQGALFPELDQQSEYMRSIWLQLKS